MSAMTLWKNDSIAGHVPWNINSSCGSTKYRLDAEAKGSMAFRIPEDIYIKPEGDSPRVL